MTLSDVLSLVTVIYPLGSFGEGGGGCCICCWSCAVAYLSDIGKYVVNTFPSSVSAGFSNVPSELLDEIETSISHIDFISASSTSYVVATTVHIDASRGALLQPAFQHIIQYVPTKKASHKP